ncbi:MAG: hypothetical protein J6O04_01995, partial [Selenomonadaceae bacterium]|nr:hypothetical protein [Selenomonadaceae bacterium]
SPFRGGNVKVTFLLYIHKMRNQRASPERGGARRAEGLTMKSNIFLFLLPVNSNAKALRGSACPLTLPKGAALWNPGYI